MSKKSRFFENEHEHGDIGYGHGPSHDHHSSDGWHGDDGWDDNGGCNDDVSSQFHFDFPSQFKVDISDLDLKSLGKVTDFDVEDSLISVTLGQKWTFEITGSDLEVTFKKGATIPVSVSGTINSFSIDGPGKADFSISGLDIDAKAFVHAVTHLQTATLLDMVLGGDETISGSGFSDLLYGGKGDDTLLGNKGADQVMGGAGDDVINGGQQSDLLIGGGGADRFVFSAKSGMDLILDFDASSDKLDLTALGFSTLDDVLPGHGHGHGCGRCWQPTDNTDVVLDLGDGNMVKLLGVSASELNSDNVLI